MTTLTSTFSRTTAAGPAKRDSKNWRGSEAPAVHQPRRTPEVRLEVIDTSHRKWPAVLAAIRRDGQGELLLIDGDGWLSARQAVLAAFAGDEVVGHLCFRVEPVRSTAGESVRENGRPMLEARLDRVAVESGFDDAGVERLLGELADQHAALLQCGPVLRRVV